jgi:hypothetical protein
MEDRQFCLSTRFRQLRLPVLHRRYVFSLFDLRGFRV